VPHRHAAEDLGANGRPRRPALAHELRCPVRVAGPSSQPARSDGGEVLGWDDARREQELARYEAQMDADRQAQREPDDDAAVAARRQVLPDGAV
jgi:hypothetical protein